MTYATLPNLGDIQRKDLRIGDTVFVKRDGEVIPAVVAPVLEKRPPEAVPWAMPSTCPSCGSPVVQPEGEAAVYCDDAVCPAQAERRLTRLRDHQVRQLLSAGVLASPPGRRRRASGRSDGRTASPGTPDRPADRLRAAEASRRAAWWAGIILALLAAGALLVALATHGPPVWAADLSEAGFGAEPGWLEISPPVMTILGLLTASALAIGRATWLDGRIRRWRGALELASTGHNARKSRCRCMRTRWLEALGALRTPSTAWCRSTPQTPAMSRRYAQRFLPSECAGPASGGLSLAIPDRRSE